MIIAKTKLKKIPEKCIKCKFCYEPGGFGVAFDKHIIAYKYKLKRCFLTGVQVPYIFDKEKRTGEYSKCKSCPLEETN